MQKISKSFSNTYLYNKSGEYEKKIVEFLMRATPIEKKDKAFDDIRYDVKRRQLTSSLMTVLDYDKVILLTNQVPLPRAFKVFTAKDIRGDGSLKVFIDCSEILKLVDGTWTCNNKVDILIAYLISAMTNAIYYSEPNRLNMNISVIKDGATAFSSLFTYIIDYLFKISLVDTTRDNCIYLAATYYQTNILGKDPIAESVRGVSKNIANISDRQVDVVEMYYDEHSFDNIKTFIEMVSRCLKLNKLNLDNFIEKWLYLYGSGTHFALELFPSFSSMLTDAYTGCYINNQKTIEKVAGGSMVDFTKGILNLGSNLFTNS